MTTMNDVVMWWNIISIAIILFYTLPWLILHGWVLWQVFTGDDSLGEDKQLFQVFTVIVGVIPLINFYLVWEMFVVPLIYKIRLRDNPVPMPKTKDYEDKSQ